MTDTDRALRRSLAWLDKHINLEATAGDVDGLSLDSMRSLMRALGDPQLDVPAVHVTGTNGKGSVSHLISRLLMAGGLSVGTYASPHVSALNERMRWNGDNISDEALLEQLEMLELVEKHRVADGAAPASWFELVTAAAYRWFSDQAVDAAVVEVGKLGRWDATNVIDAGVAVVTNIGFDHTDGRDGWERAIAEEKAGIIKPGSALALGQTTGELRKIFEAENPDVVVEIGRDVIIQSDQAAVGGRLLDIRTPRGFYEDVLLALHGRYQSANAALALAAAELAIDGPLEHEMVMEAFGGAALAGRFEILHAEPLVVLDGAHNRDGARAAAATLAEDFAVGGETVLVIGLLGPKNVVEMLEELRAGSARDVICCTIDWPRSIPASEIAAAAATLGITAEVVSDPDEAVRRALSLSTEADAILVAGSLYLAGQIRNNWDSIRPE